MSLNLAKKLFNPIINYFGSKKMERFTEEPIVIGGCGRSGTTLLLSILGAHPNIYSFSKEIGIFLEWRKKEDESDYLYYPRIDRLNRFVLMNKIPVEAKRWCEKTPGNIRNFDKILDYFDNRVKLINIIRDGRDIMLSKHPKKEDDYWVSPERWVNDVKAGLKFKDHPQVLTIKYEDLILNYHDLIVEICDFIDEDCPEEVYNWFEHTNVKKSKAWSHSAQKIHSKSIKKWEKEENKERVEEIMANDEVVDLLEQLNYL